MGGKANSRTVSADKDRRLSVVVFALFFSWLLAFPFEGRVLYEVAGFRGVSTQSYVPGAMAAHFVGLIACGFCIKSMLAAKRLILFSIAFCAAATGVFFFHPSYLWAAALYPASFLVGACVAAWGFYFKGCTTKGDRIKTMADGLIFSNILMILLNMSAALISPQIGLGCSILVLVAAFAFALKLPGINTVEAIATTSAPLPVSVRAGKNKASAATSAPVPVESTKPKATAATSAPVPVESTKPKAPPPVPVPISGQGMLSPGKSGAFAFLCIFIVVVTINSGLMYQVVNPAFAHLKLLTGLYWAAPYIAAMLIMRNLPRKTNRAYTLYVAIAMIGFSFIAFLMLGRSWADYLVVNTLLLGACGVYDLFWWSILGEMLEHYKNPARIIGIGLAANVLGVFLGGFVGNMITSVSGQTQNHTLLALGVVCVTLIMLPPLHNRLTKLLKTHAYLTAFLEMPVQEQERRINELDLIERLTERENEVMLLLINGKTNKEIADELIIVERTVKYHVSNIYAKTGVSNRTELTNLILRKPQPPQ